MKHLTRILLAAALACPAAAAAQTDPLQAVEDMIASGRFTQARTTLDRWQSEHPPGTASATAEQRARALLLRARLATDGIEAQENYLSLVLSYPSSAHAPEALLRLGQALLAGGETARATSYLQRLVTEHPASPQRVAATLWLARAQGATGAWPSACQTARDGLARNPSDAELAGLLRTEEETACSRPAEATAIASGQPTAPAARQDDRAPAAQPARRENPTERATGASARADSAAFTVQVAAVRSRENAHALASRLRRSGFDARVVTVAANALVRVRVGRHASRQDAADAARTLREAGFEAIIVDDARTERTVGR